jgi:hypothetical protein
MIRVGQARWSAQVDLPHRFILGLFAATNYIPDRLPVLRLDYKLQHIMPKGLRQALDIDENLCRFKSPT